MTPEFIAELIQLLDNYAADLNLASNYGEFAQSPEGISETYHRIDSAKEKLEHIAREKLGSNTNPTQGLSNG